MQKKLICLLLSSVGFAATSSAAQVSNSLMVEAYGKVGMMYKDSVDEYYYENSHLNVAGSYKINNKNYINVNIGTRSTLPTESDYGFSPDDIKYNFFVDEAYYHFAENDVSEMKLGRFFNPVGLFGKTQNDYFAHPFEEDPNHITTVDGILLGYTAELQRNTYVKFDTFVGTNLDTTYINGKEVDLDTNYNFGANATFIMPSVRLNFGLYSSQNGKDLKVDGVNQNIPDTPLYYQANIGLEVNKSNVYFMTEYNVYEYLYDDDIESRYDEFDVKLGYRIGKFLPMMGYSYDLSESYMGETFEEQTFKAGLRYDITKNLAFIGSYNYTEDLVKNGTDTVYKADIAFKF